MGCIDSVNRMRRKRLDFSGLRQPKFLGYSIYISMIFMSEKIIPFFFYSKRYLFFSDTVSAYIVCDEDEYI